MLSSSVLESMTDEEVAEIKTLLSRRMKRDVSIRGDIAPPESAKRKLSAGFLWASVCFWQDRPWLVAATGLMVLWKVVEFILLIANRFLT